MNRRRKWSLWFYCTSEKISTWMGLQSFLETDYGDSIRNHRDKRLKLPHPGQMAVTRFSAPALLIKDMLHNDANNKINNGNT